MIFCESFGLILCVILDFIYKMISFTNTVDTLYKSVLGTEGKYSYIRVV